MFLDGKSKVKITISKLIVVAFWQSNLKWCAHLWQLISLVPTTRWAANEMQNCFQPNNSCLDISV